MGHFYLTSAAIYVTAAIAEIAGCFALWAWLRQDKSAWWLLPGMTFLLVFAWLFTRIDVGFAGRTYAAYGGIYIVSSLIWLWFIEGVQPTGWDVGGAGLAVLGTVVILTGAQLAR